MLNHHPRPDEFFNGILENPISAASFLGQAYSQKFIKVLFSRDEKDQNSGKNVSRYKNEFDILLRSYDFVKKEYRASIVTKTMVPCGNETTEQINYLAEIMGFFSIEETGIINGIKFFATSGSYPIDEEKEVMLQ